MKKRLFTRIAGLLLAGATLVSSISLTVGASVEGEIAGSNLTEKTIAQYADKVNTISYDDYVATYFNADLKVLDKEVSVDLTDNWTYTSTSGDVITMTNGVWKMVTSSGTVYNSVAEAVAGGYEKSNLCYAEVYDDVKSVYTPSTGDIVWNVNLKELTGTSDATLWNIALDYYPVEGKSSSIEREFYINGEAPFSEARSLSLAKIWSTEQQNGDVLKATYTLTKKDNASDIIAKAKSVGLTVSQNDDTLTFIAPDTFTSDIVAFTDEYELRFFTVDATDNEIRPGEVQTPEWTTYTLRDSQGFNHDSDDYDSFYFGFVLQPGKYAVKELEENPSLSDMITFSLEGINEPMALSSLRLIPYQYSVSYETYYASVVNEVGNKQGSDKLRLEAEYTSHTSTNVVYPVEDRTSALSSPVDTTRTVLNTIGTEKWETAGQWVEYTFTVNDSGFYDVWSRFKQSYLDGMYVNRSLQIFTDYESQDAYQKAIGHKSGYYNGLPFAEAARLRYDYDNNWQVTKLVSCDIVETGDGTSTNTTTHQLYFEKGVVYTIRLEVTLGSMSSLITDIEDILNALNDDYLTIIKLTGTSPDDYRDYSFSRLLPDTLIDMIRQSRALDEISEFLHASGDASTYSGICDKLSNLLTKMAYDEDAIAQNLDNFKSYVGSLGTFLTDAKTQPLQIDYLLIQGSDETAPKGKPNFFQTAWHEIKSFIQSFFRDYNSMGAMDDGDSTESISVWLPYGRDQATVIRNLATNDFTQDTNISVDLKLITAGTLLPSILAGMGPDVYLGLAQANVINYAIRGALENIEDYEGFEDALVNFNDAAITVLEIADNNGDMHVYGLPEQQSFPMMFVRYDILNDLGIEIPKTWSELLTAQSKLKSNNMEIGIVNSYKTHLYQMGGDLWADGGMRINLDSEIGLEAFQTNSDLFTQYSFPYSYDAANRFRTGEMPIIIADYISLYNKLKVFATEIEGCWTFVPQPGYEETDEDGNVITDENGNAYINNDSISSVTAAVMIAGSDNSQGAWKFILWYCGAEAQADYANEMVAIIGDSAKHSTANREALKSMPWTADEYEEVSKQFENLASVANYPGYYYIDRYTEFAFLAAYNDDADPVTEIQSYINTINAEITRKRKEFGLETLEDVDDDGQAESDLFVKRTKQARSAIELLIKKYGSSYESLQTETLRAIANEKVLALQTVASEFEEKLLGEWNGEMITITKEFNDKKTDITVESYFVYVNKQTNDQKDGGYDIDSLNEIQLLYFISTCLSDAADALASY